MTTTLTLKLRLYPTVEQQEALRAAQETFRAACAYYAVEMLRRRTTHRAALHALYGDACSRFPTLPPATIQLAQAKAATAVRSFTVLKNQGRKVSPPAFRRPVPLVVRRDYYRLEPDEDGTGVLKVLALRGQPRLAMAVQIPAFQKARLQSISEGKARAGTVEIWQDRKGRWWAAFSIHIDVPPARTCGYLGVDVGVARLAVTSDATFFPGGPIRWRRTNWERRRGALQQAGRLARVKRAGGRQRRWLQDFVHKVSRQLVDAALMAGQGLALERLTDIRSRIGGSPELRRRLHRDWPFQQLAQRVTYKSALLGLPVRLVDPSWTSKTCIRCGHIDRRNRVTRSRFRCRRCRYELDADLLAARNIARRGSEED